MPTRLYLLPALPRAKSPAGNMAEYVPGSNATGNLRGNCPDCDRLIYRRVNPTKSQRIRESSLEVTFTEAPPRIKGSDGPSVNCEFNESGQP